MNIFVFDIETVPDVATGRRLYGLDDPDDLDDNNVARVMFHKRATESGGSEFLRHHLHRIVAISVVLRTELTQENKSHLTEFLDNWQDD